MILWPGRKLTKQVRGHLGKGGAPLVKVMVSRAAPGEGSGSKGGVAIFARDFLGLHHGFSSASPSRVVSGVVGIPGGLEVCVTSLYLYDGAGIDQANQQLLADAGQASAGSCSPWIIGGDFNLPP